MLNHFQPSFWLNIVIIALYLSPNSWQDTIWPIAVGSIDSAMSLLRNLKKVLSYASGGSSNEKERRARSLVYIKRDQDPRDLWEIVGELGDGAFGKVYKVWFCLHVVSF